MDQLEQMRLLYPRVSEIIGKQTERQMRAIPIETLANACLRGTIVHGYCTSHLKSLFAEYEEEYIPYINAFIEWCDEFVDYLIYSEVRLYDDEKKFTGKFDAIVKLKNSTKTALIDIKTSATSSLSWPIQLAAYKHLCKLNGYNPDYVWNIHLKKTKPAKYDIINEEKVMISPAVIKAKKIEKEDLDPYWNIFASAWTCYNYFEKKEVESVEL